MVLSVGPIENAIAENANQRTREILQTPQQILAAFQKNIAAADKRMIEAEAAAGRGEVAMVANLNVSKSIADIERRAKIVNPTFKTEAWYTSMQPGRSPGKAKDDDLER